MPVQKVVGMLTTNVMSVNDILILVFGVTGKRPGSQTGCFRSAPKTVKKVEYVQL